MKNEFNKYGKRLTEKEYTQACADLFPQSSDASGKFTEAMRREKETSLMIDHRLGINFPTQQRKSLHLARERATRKFTRNPTILLKALFVTAAQRVGLIRGVPDFDNSSLDLASRTLAEEFCREPSLNTEDIIQFLGSETTPYVKKIRKGR
jgi:hypothetical protein